MDKKLTVTQLQTLAVGEKAAHRAALEQLEGGSESPLLSLEFTSPQTRQKLDYNNENQQCYLQPTLGNYHIIFTCPKGLSFQIFF